MALRLADGFSQYGTLAGLELGYDTTTFARYTATGGRNNGAYTYQAGSGTRDILLRTFDYQRTWHVGVAIYRTNASRSDTVITWRDNATAQCALGIADDGTVRLYRGTTTLLATSGVTVPTESWQYLELSCYIHDTDGWMKGYLNEALACEYDGNTEATSAIGGANRLVLSATINHRLTDLWVTDGEGAAPYNDRLGDCHMVTGVPTGPGHYEQFTAVPGTGERNWENVDDIPPDGDTTYNYRTTGGKDSFGFTATPPAGIWSVVGVQCNVLSRKDEFGSAMLRPFYRRGGTDYPGDTSALGYGYYFYNQMCWPLNPATGLPWVLADLTSPEFGYERLDS
jgi:hypothetical protein